MVPSKRVDAAQQACRDCLARRGCCHCSGKRTTASGLRAGTAPHRQCPLLAPCVTPENRWSLSIAKTNERLLLAPLCGVVWSHGRGLYAVQAWKKCGCWRIFRRGGRILHAGIRALDLLPLYSSLGPAKVGWRQRSADVSDVAATAEIAGPIPPDFSVERTALVGIPQGWRLDPLEIPARDAAEPGHLQWPCRDPHSCRCCSGKRAVRGLFRWSSLTGAPTRTTRYSGLGADMWPARRSRWTEGVAVYSGAKVNSKQC